MDDKNILICMAVLFAIGVIYWLSKDHFVGGYPGEIGKCSTYSRKGKIGTEFTGPMGTYPIDNLNICGGFDSKFIGRDFDCVLVGGVSKTGGGVHLCAQPLNPY